MPIHSQEILYENSDYLSWQYFIENILNSPAAGIIIICIIILYLYWQFQSTNQKLPKTMKEVSQQEARQRLKIIVLNAIHDNIKSGQIQSAISQIQDWQHSLAQNNEKNTVLKSKIQVFKQKHYLFGNQKKESIIYETRDEREQKINQEKERIRKQQKEEEKDRLDKERKKMQERQKKIAEAEKKKQISNPPQENQLGSNQSIRSDKRKPTIEQYLKGDVDSIKQNQTKKNIDPPQFELGSTEIKKESLFSIPNIPKIGKTNSINIKQENKPAIQNLTFNQPNVDNKTIPTPTTLVNNITPPAFQIQPSNKEPIITGPKKDNIVVSPQIIGASIPFNPRPIVPVQVANVKLDFSSEQFLETLTNFGEKVCLSAEITTTMSNLGGARSSLNDLLIFSKSFIDTINKQDDKQVTTFAIKIYDSIVHKLISNSNLKDGLERMPPKSKTNQVQKNSINCYILIVNIYRMMGYEKIWTIIFGKTLKLLEFIFKRKEDLASFKHLDLIANKYIELRGDLSGKYLSRIDYLSYLLFGLTAFDPLMIFSQVEQKERDVRKSREEIQSWGNKWSYKQFWILSDAFFKNKHDSYLKPIIYMNLLAVLYPRVYEYKCNPSNFERQNQLYKIILDLGKQYFTRYRTIKEIEILSEQLEGNHEGYHYEYDGQDFKQGIKVLQNRITVEKAGEFRLNAREFDAKANIFYYFSKQK